MPSTSGETGRKTGIGSTPIRLTTRTDLVANEGVQILTDANNTDKVWVGIRDTITANSGDSTDGFPVKAGAGIFVPFRKPYEIYLQTPGSGTVWFMVI